MTLRPTRRHQLHGMAMATSYSCYHALSTLYEMHSFIDGATMLSIDSMDGWNWLNSIGCDGLIYDDADTICN